MADSFKLVSTAGEQTVDVKPGATLIVGRAVSSDVPIYDPTISRQHAQVSLQNGGGGVLVKDLGSSNGTFLNGSRITEAVCQPNDVVMFGKVSFYVREVSKTAPPAQPATPPGGHAAPPAGGTIVRQLPVGAEGALSGRVKRLSLEKAAAPSPEDTLATEQTAKSAKKLELLLEISKALSRQQDVDKLLESIADMSFQVMAVDYVSILMGSTVESMVPRISKSRLGGSTASSRVPKGIVGPVVSDRVALLTDNAAEDTRLKGGTIVQQSVRSAMCAPLLASDGSILGVMYVDNRSATHAYKDDDLDFLIGFSGVASVAIENSALADRLRREALVLSNFQRFFSPDLAKTIAEHGEEVKLGGTKREVVILFSDIRGFTSMSERMDPDDVAHMLREYFTEMVEIIFRHGGTLDKFIGDAIMALWGAPIGTEHDADNAMQAAIEMQQKLIELNEHWKTSGKPAVQIGIGINSGNVFAGNIGSEQRLEYTVLGDAVNTASRLCSNAAKGEILVSEQLFKRLKQKPKSEKREPLKVKNKEQLVPVLLVKH